MGFLDSLLGRSKVKGPAPDRLFAITTAAIALETGPGIRTRGSAAIVFQPLATGDFAQIVSEMEEVVRGTGEETGTTLETSDDTYGYRWMVLKDPDIEDLAVGVLLYLAFAHPLIALAVLAIVVALTIWLIPKIWRFVRRLFARLSGGASTS